MNRVDAIAKMKSEQFDICIIGGGATGAGCALDAAMRGLKVCLIEKNDFASQTSSKSTKLIHGGVRYLEQAVKTLDFGQFKMVSKALKERTTLLKNAPHLSRPLALVTPCYNWFEWMYYGIGLKVYDWIAGSHTIASSSLLSKKNATKLIPELKGGKISHAVLYYDGQMDDARYCLAIIQSASEKGASIANHLQINRFHKRENSGRLKAAEVLDTLTGDVFEINAKVFVNATGPFSDHVRLMANAKLNERMRVSKGSHIVIDRKFMLGDTAILVPKTDDGRVIFMIPWQNEVLIGTTDLEDTLSETPEINTEEVAYLVDYANRYLNGPITTNDVKATFCGQRPLLQASFSADTKSLIRDHEVEIDRKTKLVSILGGKWTTYRLMAKDTLDQIYKEIWDKKPEHCTTDKQILFGGEGYSFEQWENLCEEFKIEKDIAQHLLKKYGAFAKNILETSASKPEYLQRILPNYSYIMAEIPFIISNEMAFTLEDVLRRLGIKFIDKNASENLITIINAYLNK